MLIRLRRAHADLTQRLGHEPTTIELASQLGVGQRQVEEILPLLQEPLSLAETDADAARAITERYTRALERLVRRHPEQYFWLHRRWKHQPRLKRAAKSVA